MWRALSLRFFKNTKGVVLPMAVGVNNAMITKPFSITKQHINAVLKWCEFHTQLYTQLSLLSADF